MKMKIIIASGLAFLGVCSYFSFFITLYFIAGALWSLVNLFFIQQLLYEVLLVNPKNLLKIILLALVKFPLLYGMGFGLLYYQGEYGEFAWVLLAGFSAVLLLSMQKRFWKVFQPKEKGDSEVRVWYGGK